MSLRHTALYNEHLNLKGKMVPFAGYEMPVSYTTVKEEWQAVRSNAGLFDISHMAPVFLAGNNQEILKLLNYVTCREVSQLAIGQVQYNALMNLDGGLVDDITIYFLKENRWMLIVNAANKKPVLQHLETYNKELDTKLHIHIPGDYTLLALQGPNAANALTAAKPNLKATIDQLYFYEFATLDDSEMPTILSRTGYTGEDGFEILQPAAEGVQTWQALLNSNALPCGLAARDMLRLEVLYPLYGNELNAQQGPHRSGIGWLLSNEKEFLGKEPALQEKKNATQKTYGFRCLGPGVPRSTCAVLDKNDQQVGIVTSGTFCFQFNSGFGMALFERGREKEKDYFIQVRTNKIPIETFIKSPYQGSIRRR